MTTRQFFLYAGIVRVSPIVFVGLGLNLFHPWLLGFWPVPTPVSQSATMEKPGQMLYETWLLLQPLAWFIISAKRRREESRVVYTEYCKTRSLDKITYLLRCILYNSHGQRLVDGLTVTSCMVGSQSDRDGIGGRLTVNERSTNAYRS